MRLCTMERTRMYIPMSMDTIFKGTGMPAVCACLQGSDFQQVLDVHAAYRQEAVDLFEWRTDYLVEQGWKDLEGINATLEKMKAQDRRPIILTLRSEEEGGHTFISPRDYRETIQAYALTAQAPLLDIEAFGVEKGMEQDLVEFLVSLAKENGKKVILSNHNFEETPPQRDIYQRLERMQAMGADLPKVAYMPQEEKDVHQLLAAAQAYWKKNQRPFIALSMGALGQKTRLLAGKVGSRITFAAGKGATAPGQFPAQDMRQALENIYQDR